MTTSTDKEFTGTPCASEYISEVGSQASQGAVSEKLLGIKRGRLAAECSKLEPSLEKALAEEGLTEDMRQWTAY